MSTALKAQVLISGTEADESPMGQIGYISSHFRAAVTELLEKCPREGGRFKVQIEWNP